MIDEKRDYTRVPFDCDLVYVYDDVTYHGKLLNISEGGIKFQGPQLVPVLAGITVTLLGDPPLSLQGLAIWTGRIESQITISVKFMNLSQEQKYSLALLLAADQ